MYAFLKRQRVKFPWDLHWKKKNKTYKLRACLHGGGGPQEGEVTRLGGVTRLSIQSLILM